MATGYQVNNRQEDTSAYLGLRLYHGTSHLQSYRNNEQMLGNRRGLKRQPELHERRPMPAVDKACHRNSTHHFSSFLKATAAL